MLKLKSVQLLVVALLLLRPTIALAQQQGPSYIVKDGDSLFAIAQIVGTTVDDLAAANEIEDPSTIFPGQELVIPGFEGLVGVLEFADVGYGENLRSIALRYGQDTELLGRLNRVLNPQRLVVGQSIVVPVEQESGSGLETSMKRSLGHGESLLEVAASMGVDPWGLSETNQFASRRWTVPNELFYAEGDEALTTALPPEFGAVSIGPIGATQGKTVSIGLDAPIDTEMSAQLGPWPLSFVQSTDGTRVALQGIHALADTGLNDLQLAAAGTAGYSQPVFVRPGNYGQEALQVPPETLDPANTGPEDELVAGVVGQVTPEKLWEGTFSFPATFFEAFPSVFGTRRSYNGSEFTYYHTGLDLFGSSSTPVLAPARGRVAFSDFLTVRGNVTYIDHGWGVFSGFLHQSESLVEPGQMVEPGETIGFVGGTGRVTGPHLHWEVWVGGVPIDPVEWTATVFP